MTTSTTLELGLVGLLTRPVLHAVYPEVSDENAADFPKPPAHIPKAVPLKDGDGTIQSDADSLRSPTPYYTPGTFDDGASFMNGTMNDDDLAGRTANLAVTDGGGLEQPANNVAARGAFPPMKSVWPTTTHAPTSPAGPNTTFDVADRSFDKDPGVLRAEHARVAPAVYYRESPLREVPPTMQANEPHNGLAAGAAGAAGGAGLLAAGQGLLHPSPSAAPRSVDGQIGDTRHSRDLDQIQGNDFALAPAANAAAPITAGQPNMPQTSDFVPASVPQPGMPHTNNLAAQNNMPPANDFAPQPEPIPQANGFATQHGALPDAQDPALQNQVDPALQQPNNHNAAKAAGVGAGAGLAAAGAAHMLHSEPQPHRQGDYFGGAGAPEPSMPMPAPQEPQQQPMRALSPTQEVQAVPPTQQLAAAPQANGNGIASPAPLPAGGSFKRVSGQHVEGYGSPKHERTVSEMTRANTAANAQVLDRPQMYDAPSRSYMHATTPPETRYERPLDGVQRRLSNQSVQGVSRSGSTKFVEQPPASPGGHAAMPLGAAAAGAAGGLGGAALADHVHSPRADPYARPASAQEFGRRSSGQAEVDGPFAKPQRPASAMAAPRDGSIRRDGSRGSYGSLRGQTLSPSASMRGHGRLPPIADEAGYAGVGAGAGLAVGEVASLGRQHEMQGRTLRDDGPVQYERPYSQFGHRPEAGIGDWQSRREEGRLARSGTALSRTTVGRSGTARSRRSGAFGRGAGLTVGTQPEDVLGRDDIHERTEVAERVLSPATLRKLQGMEKKEGRAFAKMLKAEGKEQTRAVGAAIADLKRMAKMQKGSIESERKSQRHLAKWTARENRARMRFLKEKERYEKAEGELRNAENDYEERRDHAAGLTAQIAEKTQELDDLRAQKAADDREREVKLLAIKNPGHV